MGEVRTSEEWNRSFEEDRMRYIDSQPATAAPKGATYRRVLGSIGSLSGEGLFITNDKPPQMFIVTHENFMAGRWGSRCDVTEFYSEEERYKLMYEAFPLEKETLDVRN